MSAPRFSRAKKFLDEETIERNLEQFSNENLQDSTPYVFAYGSLIFRPDMEFQQRIIARVFGFRRRFGLWSVLYRGSLRKPGLVLGLDYGGSCWGIAYRLRNDSKHEPLRTLRKLWKREMFTDGYVPRLLRVVDQSGQRLTPCLGFVLRPSSSQYAGGIDEQLCIRTIAKAKGISGSNRAYLHETQRGLASVGLRCSYIDRLARALDVES